MKRARLSTVMASETGIIDMKELVEDDLPLVNLSWLQTIIDEGMSYNYLYKAGFYCFVCLIITLSSSEASGIGSFSI